MSNETSNVASTVTALSGPPSAANAVAVLWGKLLEDDVLERDEVAKFDDKHAMLDAEEDAYGDDEVELDFEVEEDEDEVQEESGDGVDAS